MYMCFLWVMGNVSSLAAHLIFARFRLQLITVLLKSALLLSLSSS